MKVRLVVSPGTAGFNDFTLDVNDYETGAPVNASSVELEFTQPLRPQLGESTLTLHRQRDGSLSARGGNLSIAGIWEVVAIVENGANSTEVHLQVTTIGAAPTVTATRFVGLPTLYSIQLQNGWLAQVYLDPDKAGADEFHVTFFANANETSEIQMASATVGMTVSGGTPTILVTRRLDPIGHFVLGRNGSGRPDAVRHPRDDAVGSVDLDLRRDHARIVSRAQRTDEMISFAIRAGSSR